MYNDILIRFEVIYKDDIITDKKVYTTNNKGWSNLESGDRVIHKDLIR